MLDDLQALDADRPRDAPRLVVISSGEAEENRAMELRAPVVRDLGGRLMASLGVRGTPSAVLVDADGRIASARAVGATDVLRLARSAERLAR
jgi:hypothetical protein